MSERNLPPDVGPSQQPYACERFVGGSPCGKAAVWHIIWDETIRNGCACEEHGMEAIKKWEPWFIHKIAGPACCGAPGARFYIEENTCKIDDFQEKLDRSSLGDPVVKSLAAKTPPEVVERILEKVRRA